MFKLILLLSILFGVACASEYCSLAEENQLSAGVWNDLDNWLDHIPNEWDDVVISKDIELHTEATVSSITLVPGVSFAFHEGGVLTLSGTAEDPSADCEAALVAACNSSSCQNGGSCVDYDGIDFTCECVDGYEGDMCEITSSSTISSSSSVIYKYDKSSSSSSVGKGKPDSGISSSAKPDSGISSSAGTSSVSAATSSVSAATSSVVINVCLSSPCMNGGDCSVDAYDTIICVCDSDYSGPYCEEIVTVVNSTNGNDTSVTIIVEFDEFAEDYDGDINTFIAELPALLGGGVGEDTNYEVTFVEDDDGSYIVEITYTNSEEAFNDETVLQSVVNIIETSGTVEEPTSQIKTDTDNDNSASSIEEVDSSTLMIGIIVVLVLLLLVVGGGGAYWYNNKNSATVYKMPM